MDNKSIKLLYEEAVNIKNSLTPELNSVRFHDCFYSVWTRFISRLELRNWSSQSEIQLFGSILRNLKLMTS